MNRNKTRLPDNRGITLVETIVASLLMVIGALVLSTGFIASTRMMSVSAADRKTAQAITANMNVGGSATSSTNKPITFSIDGFDFSVNGQMQEYTDSTNENIKFYRIG